MQYYSHVLRFPNRHPFDKEEFRWASFVGAFVAPLMKIRTELYWFTYYGNVARFRVLTDNYESLRQVLEPLRDKLGLEDTGEEKDLTLFADLGHQRFIGSVSGSTVQRRTELVLRYLNSVALLFVDNLTLRSDGYWEIEKSTDPENPLGNNFESLAHLLANMTRFEFDVFLGHRTIWQPMVATQALRCRL